MEHPNLCIEKQSERWNTLICVGKKNKSESVVHLKNQRNIMNENFEFQFCILEGHETAGAEIASRHSKEIFIQIFREKRILYFKKHLAWG